MRAVAIRWPAALAGTLLGSTLQAAAASQVIDLLLPSCVEGSPPVQLAAGTPMARLDAADRGVFEATAQARYPLYQRGGHRSAEVLLLRRGPHWLYVTLAPNGAGSTCVTAVFAADRFDVTPRWLAKYQPRAGRVDD